MKSMFMMAVALGLFAPASALAQHLWWNLEGQKDATCLYGEITVLATAPCIYYCGANWHPGEPAGGYCGIQHNSETERRTIFSIWDTTATLHPKVTAADPKTIFNRFGGEGEGAHTHMVWPWNIGDTFQFFVRKQQGKGDTTDTRYYIYDRSQKKWLHSATISNPNGGKASVATIGGGLNSFLENFAGKDKEVPKLALYRLWLGNSLDSMKCLTRAQGDGTWGQFHDCYFLAEGDPAALRAVFAQWKKKKFGVPLIAEKGKSLAPISDVPLPKKLIANLKKLPRANEVGEK
jgi:hypothetical protein